MVLGNYLILHNYVVVAIEHHRIMTSVEVAQCFRTTPRLTLGEIESYTVCIFLGSGQCVFLDPLRRR